MKNQTQERVVRCVSGWRVLPITVGLAVATPILFVFVIVAGDRGPNLWFAAACVSSCIAAIASMKGFFTLQPNNACVLNLFGRYVGTEKTSGFH